jgi:hypothetical protein
VKTAIFNPFSTWLRASLLTLALTMTFICPSISWGKEVDREWVQAQYQSGEFGSVKSKLQGLLKSRQPLSKSDSIFVYKYVSVVTAADSGNKQVAKDYMYKLLTIQPNIDIIDLYVSESVYSLFQDVRKEFNTRNAYASKKETIEAGETPLLPTATESKRPIPMPQSASRNAKAEASSSRAWLYWTLGGVAVTGVAIGAYYLTQEHDGPKTNTLTTDP